MSRAWKKRKKQTKLTDCGPRPSKSVTKNDSCSLQDDIINHLQLLRESRGLVVGFSAVKRGIRRNSLIVVLSITRKAAPIMCHTLSAMCRERQILLLRLQDIDSLLLSSSLPSAAAYGIKGDALMAEPKLSNLYKRINDVHLVSLKKSSGQKEADGDPHVEAEEPSEDEGGIAEGMGDGASVFDNVVHYKHGGASSTGCGGGKADAFISLDVYAEPENEYFPDYASDWADICISIQQ